MREEITLYTTYENGTMLRIFIENGNVVIEMCDPQTNVASGRAIMDHIAICCAIENGDSAISATMEDGT